MKERWPLISIIVVSYDGLALTERCLKSILENTEYPNYEVILVFYGSSPPKASPSPDPRIRMIRVEGNIGYSEANNLGLRHARGQFIAFLNNDTVVERGWLKALYDILTASGPDVAAVQSKLLLLGHHGRIDAVGLAFSPLGFLRPVGFMEPDEGQYDSVHELCVIQPAACLIRRSVIEEVGGLFDPDYFWGHEDTDFSIRLHLRGYRMLFCPSSVVYHVRSATISRARPESLTYYFRRNVLLTMLKNYGLKMLLRYLPAHLAILTGMVLWYLASGQGLHALAVLKALWWNLRNLKATLAKRALIQARVRKVPDEVLVEKLKGPSLVEIFSARRMGPLTTVHLSARGEEKANRKDFSSNRGRSPC